MSNLNIHQKINFRALANEFPQVARDQFKARFRSLKIGVSGDLERDMTFRGKVLVNGVMVEFDYWYYGIFTAKGVGKGISETDGNISRLVGSGRKKKPWTKGIANMRYRLGELYQEIAADEITQHINQSYDRTIRFKL